GGDELSLLRAEVSKLHHLPSGRERRTASFYATDTVYMLVMHDPLEATESIMTTVAMVMENDGRRAAEEEHHCSLFRDIFGNPFRPLPSLDRLQSARNGRIITDLAKAIYEERTFDRLPILADALEAAGCVDGEILSHCRQPGPHVRGCWVLDFLLGRH